MQKLSDNLGIGNTIFGISSTKLTEEEKTFFREIHPLGFILFKRNCKTKEQIKYLVHSLKELLEREEILILIDQEGGRVSRLTPPEFRKALPAQIFGEIAKQDIEKAKKAVYINHLLIGRELRELGINVDCAPVADLLHNGADNIIGDRSFSEDKNIVATLCQIADLGLRDAKVQSIIKHIPGHGRATLDSHLALPTIDSALSELENTDFDVFKKLSGTKIAMTAHIVYQALDSLPATISKIVINYIKHHIGFDGLLMTDDLSMKALSGSLKQNAIKAQRANCDILLHCNGNIKEMKEIAQAAQNLNDKQLHKLNKLNIFEKAKPYDEELYDMGTIQLEEMLSSIVAI